MEQEASETEEERPWTSYLNLSLTPTVFTASADLEGLLQRVCVCLFLCCVREWLLKQVVFIFIAYL